MEMHLAKVQNWERDNLRFKIHDDFALMERLFKIQDSNVSLIFIFVL